MTMITQERTKKKIVTKDPAVRKDGRCYQCKGPRLEPKPGYPTDLDPFCCAKCCRAYYGAPLDQPRIVA